MGRYEVIVSHRAETMLKQHVEFLSRVRLPAARSLRREYAGVLVDLEDNPFQLPPLREPSLPGDYRGALFGKRYKAVFFVEGETVFLDAVLDCRMDNGW